MKSQTRFNSFIKSSMIRSLARWLSLKKKRRRGMHIASDRPSREMINSIDPRRFERGSAESNGCTSIGQFTSFPLLRFFASPVAGRLSSPDSPAMIHRRSQPRSIFIFSQNNGHYRSISDDTYSEWDCVWINKTERVIIGGNKKR